MVPRVLYPLGVSTPDYLIDGEKWDLKTLTNKATENTIFNRIQKAKRQADNFIIDITNTNLDESIIKNQIKKVFETNSTKHIRQLMIFKNMDIFKIIERK